MIRKLIRQMLSAQIFSALAVSLCLLIDIVVIGRFLGEKAMAAYQLSNPLLLCIGAIGTLLSAGVQVACGKSLGKGNQKETNAGYSTALALAAAVSVLFAAAVLLFTPFLARAMGAGTEGELFEMTRGYLAGFSIGAPGSMGALVLVPFLQMAGQGNLLIVAVLSMTVADVALDLVNVLVFPNGLFGLGQMFGMGAASSLSYYVAMAITGIYFLSHRCVFHFSFRQVSLRKMAELFRGGLPAGFNMASSVLLVLIMNRILRGTGGSNAVAAFASVLTLGNTANCITTGIGGVSLTLSGILFHEEDRTGLRSMIRLLIRYGVFLGLGMGALLVLLAVPLVSVFLPNANETQSMAVLGLRLYAAGMIPCCINNALKNAYQGTGRVALTELTSVLEGAVFPALAAYVFSRFMGTAGAWLYFPAGEWITVLFAAVLIAAMTGKRPWKGDTGLLLKKDFGVSSGDLLEMDIHSMQEVADSVLQAEQFCVDHGHSAKVGNHIALCIEEMAGNTIQHGFARDQKHHDLSVRLLQKEKDLVLRFRDDCSAFDPVHYIPKENEDALGILLVTAFAKEAHYTYAMNLNNVCIRISGDFEENRAEDGEGSAVPESLEKT